MIIYLIFWQKLPRITVCFNIVQSNKLKCLLFTRKVFTELLAAAKEYIDMLDLII
jgi:hypothetical protein